MHTCIVLLAGKCEKILFLELRKHFQTSGVRFVNSAHKITS
jgi:hypothetical protein